MFFGHVQQIASSEARRTLLLRCPQCRSLYEVAPRGTTEVIRLTERQAKARFPGLPDQP
jgi:hypothetical protein